MNKSTQHYLTQRIQDDLLSFLPNENKIPTIIVVIPAYNELSTTIAATLDSLRSNKDTQQLETYLLLNYKETDSLNIKQETHITYNWLSSLPHYHDLGLTVMIKALSGKTAGVGQARKLLMDAAFLRYHHKRAAGIIVNLDADTIVDENYIAAIKNFFETNPRRDAASIAFSHLLNESDVEYEAILQYELHLRYFINYQRWLKLPFAYQTIGSGMAVRSAAYAREGGMNKKLAGEDFYFLHKYSSRLVLGETNETIIRPSSRRSSRVPFGTGKYVSDHIKQSTVERTTYHPESFIALQKWLGLIDHYLFSDDFTNYDHIADDTILQSFLEAINGVEAINKVLSETKAGNSRYKRFFQWFDAFLLMKYLHFARENGRPDQRLSSCVNMLFSELDLKYIGNMKEDLITIRSYDYQSNYDNQWRADLISRLSRMAAS